MPIWNHFFKMLLLIEKSKNRVFSFRNLDYSKMETSQGKLQHGQKLVRTYQRVAIPPTSSGKGAICELLINTSYFLLRVHALSPPQLSNSSQGNSSSWSAHSTLEMNYRISNKEVVKLFMGTMTRQTLRSQESYWLYFWFL